MWRFCPAPWRKVLHKAGHNYMYCFFIGDNISLFLFFIWYSFFWEFFSLFHADICLCCDQQQQLPGLAIILQDTLFSATESLPVLKRRTCSWMSRVPLELFASFPPFGPEDQSIQSIRYASRLDTCAGDLFVLRETWFPGDSLQPKSDSLQPKSDGLQFMYIILCMPEDATRAVSSEASYTRMHASSMYASFTIGRTEKMVRSSWDSARLHIDVRWARLRNTALQCILKAAKDMYGQILYSGCPIQFFESEDTTFACSLRLHLSKVGGSCWFCSSKQTGDISAFIWLQHHSLPSLRTADSTPAGSSVS